MRANFSILMPHFFNPNAIIVCQTKQRLRGGYPVAVDKGVGAVDFNFKVLVVDDMLTVRKLMEKNCKDMGFKDVDSAENGAQAWQMIEKGEKKYGLIVSDWNMPELNGLMLLKKVRGDKRFADCIFIMCTTSSEKANVIEAVKAGINQYIVKPFTPEDFKSKVELAFTKKT